MNDTKCHLEEFTVNYAKQTHEKNDINARYNLVRLKELRLQILMVVFGY